MLIKSTLINAWRVFESLLTFKKQQFHLSLQVIKLFFIILIALCNIQHENLAYFSISTKKFYD